MQAEANQLIREAIMKTDIKGLTLQELKELIVSTGEPGSRADQIYTFITKGIESLEDIPNIPKKLKEKLSEIAYVSKAAVYQKLESKEDETKKYLIELDDGNIVETVLMKYRHGLSICISTQVGCRMGCKFCASTLDGLVRNLTAGEILGQIITVQKDAGERVSNIVIMGSGEPFDNMENLERFFELVHDEKGLNIGYRHITVSTCGLVPQIERLAELEIPVNLAISLHQTQQSEREKIMPVARSYSVEELISAAKAYSEKTKRRVTYEYALIRGVNDNPQTAMQLAKLLRGSLSHVNIIPVNEIKENDFKRPDMKKVREFQNILISNKIEATVRRELGKDISGACGQLRRSTIDNKS